jgi:hypothetical protein
MADSRREYLCIEALNPLNGETESIQISQQRMLSVGRRSVGHAKECGLIVPEILQNPTAVFEGLRRDEDDDQWGCGWRCYCGIPSNSYTSDGREKASYPMQVYLVFVNDEGVAYNWRWEKADPDDPDLPINHQDRFQRRLR